MMPMKLAGGGHSNHATPTRGSVFVVEEELQEPQNRNGVEIITTERDPEGLRTSPAPVEFTHSKTGSGDGCNPRLNAAALMDLPPWSPDRTSRVAKMAAPLAMGRDLGQVVTNTPQPARMPTLATHHLHAVLSFYAFLPS
jgi:hypothetical protein